METLLLFLLRQKYADVIDKSVIKNGIVFRSLL